MSVFTVPPMFTRQWTGSANHAFQLALRVRFLKAAWLAYPISLSCKYLARGWQPIHVAVLFKNRGSWNKISQFELNIC